MGRAAWFGWGFAGAIGVAGLAAVVFLKAGANGFSARAEPSRLEALAARQARSMAMPGEARERRNPLRENPEMLEEAMMHWADHCSVCHGNDGSGAVEMGRQMYPPAPDMRKEETQRLADGELFYIIENGIRLSGMPGWGGTAAGEKDSWKLVHFIRHLPKLSAAEIGRMEAMNPKSPEDSERESAEERFLSGGAPGDVPHEHRH